MSHGMIIDLDRCIGCDACTIACKNGNGTPKGTFWTHVERIETGVYPDALIEYTPVKCNHCRNAKCVEMCPYEASVFMYDDGTVTGNKGKDYEPGTSVQILSDKCQGCNTCIAACPYLARTYDFGEWNGYYKNEKDPLTGESLYNDAEKLKEARHPYRNTVTKCTLCFDRRAIGEIPRCSQTCPTDARVYVDDVDSAANKKLIQDRRGYRLKAEYNTDSTIYYLPRKLASERDYNK